MTRSRVVLVVALVAACKSFSDPPETKGLMTLHVPPTVLADGMSSITITAQIDTIVTGTRTVVFQSTSGTFVPNGMATDSVTADGTGLATTILRSSRDTGLVHVTATYASNTLLDSLRFTLAPPLSIAITPSAFSVIEGPNFDTITAVLRRSYGFPSNGLTVTFSAYSAGDTVRGEFTSPPPSDSTGSVTVLYTPLDSGYTGPVTLKASVVTDSGTVADSIAIKIAAPPP